MNMTKLTQIFNKMTQQITTTEYADFVSKVTSKPSTDLNTLIARLQELQELGANVPQLITASHGISAEAGEFTEIVKKMLYQGKPYSEENIRHLKIEISDVIFYAQMACSALGITFDEVIQMNYEKLSARYPEGTFTVNRSENRKEGDL
jgi:NTP pyrophosphatase (non-canonical NTP hydrolase)